MEHQNLNPRGHAAGSCRRRINRAGSTPLGGGEDRPSLASWRPGQPTREPATAGRRVKERDDF